jgi:hypothetical protein
MNFLPQQEFRFSEEVGWQKVREAAERCKELDALSSEGSGLYHKNFKPEAPLQRLTCLF